jgi:hypothetical protein
MVVNTFEYRVQFRGPPVRRSTRIDADEDAGVVEILGREQSSVRGCGDRVGHLTERTRSVASGSGHTYRV